MSKKLVIIGGGPHTEVLIGLAQLAGHSLHGIVTSNAALIGQSILDVPVLGLEGEVALDPAAVTLINGVGNHASRSSTGLAPRTELYRRYRTRGFEFLPCISNHAVLMPHVTINAGVQIMPGAVIQPGAVIGENSIINTHSSIDHHAQIGAHCHIAPGVVLCGNVTVGEHTHIGAGAVVIEKIRIGRNVVIGAGSIVTRDVSDETVLIAGKSQAAGS